MSIPLKQWFALYVLKTSRCNIADEKNVTNYKLHIIHANKDQDTLFYLQWKCVLQKWERD